MAITVQEKFGRRLSGRSAEKLYQISGTEDPAAAYDAMIAEAPETLDGKVLDEDASDVDELEGISAFIGVARYTRPSFARLDVNEERRSFQATARSIHVTHSLATVSSYAPATETAPDHGGAINVTPDGVAGVDIDKGSSTEIITHRMDVADLTAAWRAAVADALDGTYNSGAFRDYAAGELHLTQVSVPEYTDDDSEVDVTFTFQVSPNATGLVVGTITGISKLGWHYLWVLYRNKDDGSGNLVKDPAAAYVEQVYVPFDYTTLGLPAS